MPPSENLSETQHNTTDARMASRNAEQARNRALWLAQEESGELEILEPVHLAALAADPRVRNALKTPELQQLIRNIDGSRCRLEALHAAQVNQPQFDAFADLLLGVIYAAEDAKRTRR